MVQNGLLKNIRIDYCDCLRFGNQIYVLDVAKLILRATHNENAS